MLLGSVTQNVFSLSVIVLDKFLVYVCSINSLSWEICCFCSAYDMLFGDLYYLYQGDCFE